MFEDTRESFVETGYFWLSSRYYSPELCRFISPDSIKYLVSQCINGLNLYAYCGNDPVNKYDSSGHSWESFWNNIKECFIKNVGFGISYENTSINPDKYWFFA